MGNDDEHDSPVVLSAAQVSEIACALAAGEARRAEVMLCAAGQFSDDDFAENEQEWASHIRALRDSADVDPAAAAHRLEAAVRSEVAELLARCDDGDESAAYPLQLVCIHLLELACVLIDRTGLPLEGLDFAIVGVRSRAKGMVRDRSAEDDQWRACAEELRDQADLLVRVSLDLYNQVDRMERHGSGSSPVPRRAVLPRRHWEALEEAFDDMCAESHGSVESVHDRGRGILETLRPRSVQGFEPRHDADQLRRACYEVIGALAHFVDDAADNPDFRREVGEKVRQLGERMLSDQPVPDMTAPTDDADGMLRRIDHAVDADVGALYERKDAGDDSVLPLLRRRALHLLELGICEAGEAGIDVTGIENTVEAAFELPAAGH